MYPDVNKKLTYETETAIYFFTNAFYPFDNFSAHTVEIWGHIFRTAEHAFQWKKFESTEPELADRIVNATSPWLAKKLSRSSKNRREDWHETRVDLMTEIVRAKVQRNEDVKEMLLGTGKKSIIENSPVDDFWGVGKDGTGQNQMGKILMKVREEIR
jgi:ribA/ribD-fused uncharacterized protein